jgi:transposase InsO family protein
MHTDFVLDALEQALYARQPERSEALVHHSDRGSQYVSIRYTERLAEAGIEPSVGSRGDSYDTQSKITLERRTDLTRAGIGTQTKLPFERWADLTRATTGSIAFALTCRSDSDVPRALPGPTYVT